MFNSLNQVLRAGALAALASGAFAQITPEIEPNETKAQATTNGVITMMPGDSITGTTTGTSTTVPGGASADTFLIDVPGSTFPETHSLTLTTTGTAGHTVTIRGLTQTAGVPNAGTDAAFQTSSAATVPARTVKWTRMDPNVKRIIVRVTGTAATTAAYSLTLTVATPSITTIPGTFVPGPITVTTVGQGHTTDTELYIYDAVTGLPVPTAHNDDEGPGGATFQSRLTRTLAAGVYRVAVSNFNTANNIGDANPDEDFQTGGLLDFGCVLANSSTTDNLNVSFSVSDGITTTPVAATKVGFFDIAFADFTVGSPTPPPVAYCFGDGSGTACPCANAGAAGNGCASSVNPNGGNLASTGTASIAADTLTLVGTGMASSSVLYFQGTTQVSAVFGDGLRCAGGTVIRLGTKTNVAGASQYPEAGDLSVSVRGNNVAGNVRNYQAWYRNAAAFCTASTFNLTNGLNVTWGA